jgi:hypothetical protein
MINTLFSNQTTNYKIYVVNRGATDKNFWCFLQQPQELISSNVYGNSDAMISVTPNYAGTNSFTIPLQYIVGAGAENRAVGLNVQIDASVLLNTQLKNSWSANYATVPPKQGPQLTLKQGTSSPDGTVVIESNSFDKVKNENNKWFSNMSFGIQSNNGFMGFTWAPSPNEKNTITPKFAFYIATGNFTSNNLVDMTSVSNQSAKVELSHFKNLEATVTLKSDGTWDVSPGSPSK